MFFLLIACAPPELDAGLILMGPDALDAGATLDIDGMDATSSLPVAAYADEEIWAVLPGGEERLLTAGAGELVQIWLEQDALFFEVALLGKEIDPDAALVVGTGGARLAEELGLEGEDSPEGLWLREPGLLSFLTDPDLPQVEAIVPLEAPMRGVPGLILETGNLASPAPSVQSGRRASSGLGMGSLVGGLGSASASTAVGGGAQAGQGAAPGLAGRVLSPSALALVGYYRSQDGVEYTLATDGSLQMVDDRGGSMSGWFTLDAGMVLFYLGGEGPVASLQVDEGGNLFGRGMELTRLEFACFW